MAAAPGADGEIAAARWPRRTPKSAPPVVVPETAVKADTVVSAASSKPCMRCAKGRWFLLRDKASGQT